MRIPGALLRASAFAAALAFLPVAAQSDEIAQLRPAAGIFEFNLPTAASPEIAIQYRGGHNTGPFHPIAGFKVTWDEAAFFYAGFGADINLGRRFVLRPTFAPGFYHQGKGKDLGAVMDFRTAIEVTWRLRGGRRFGLEMDHISNADYVIPNRGEESLVFTFAVPLGRRSYPD